MDPSFAVRTLAYAPANDCTKPDVPPETIKPYRPQLVSTDIGTGGAAQTVNDPGKY